MIARIALTIAAAGVAMLGAAVIIAQAAGARDMVQTYRLDIIRDGQIYTIDSGLTYQDCRMSRPDLADARCVREG